VRQVPHPLSTEIQIQQPVAMTTTAMMVTLILVKATMEMMINYET
jgi:hypothetical protein